MLPLPAKQAPRRSFAYECSNVTNHREKLPDRPRLDFMGTFSTLEEGCRLPWFKGNIKLIKWNGYSLPSRFDVRFLARPAIIEGLLFDYIGQSLQYSLLI